jgi:hypothetical protein
MIDDSAVENPEFYAYLRRLQKLIHKYKLKGKMSITPWVRDRGPLDDRKNPPLSKQKLQHLVNTIEHNLSPHLDINPEMITHSKTMDLRTGKLLDIAEWDWSRKQSALTLTAYISRAAGMLENVGIRTNGVTSPVDFGKKNDRNYARAVAAAGQRLGQNTTWYYLSNDLAAPAPQPKIRYLSSDKKRCTMDMLSCSNDKLLAEIVGQRKIAARRIKPLAGMYLSADGKRGRLAEVINHNGYCVFHTHWWALHNHGQQRGFRMYELVLGRLRRFYGPRLLWMKCSEIARYRHATATAKLSVHAEGQNITARVHSLVACPDFTFAVRGVRRAITAVRCGENKLAHCAAPGALRNLSWHQDGQRVYVCGDVPAGKLLTFVLT